MKKLLWWSQQFQWSLASDSTREEQRGWTFYASLWWNKALLIQWPSLAGDSDVCVLCSSRIMMRAVWQEWLVCLFVWVTFVEEPTRPSNTPAELWRKTVEPFWKTWRCVCVYWLYNHFHLPLLDSSILWFRISCWLNDFVCSNIQKRLNCMKKASTMTKLPPSTYAAKTGNTTSQQ